jgi:hypothetical protein
VPSPPSKLLLPPGGIGRCRYSIGPAADEANRP